MFPKLKRPHKALSKEECLAILQTQRRGVLSVLGEDGYPYGVPMDHYYCPEDGCLYFHSGRAGHKIDALRRCDKASYCVLDDGTPQPGHWALIFRSVIAFGRITPVEDPGFAICRRLSRRFTDDEAYIDAEIRRFGPATLVLRFQIEDLCGKWVEES